jgi:hypothetical protein
MLRKGDTMSGFLSGWRRKAGCVTLVLALVVFTGWMRSFVTGDHVVCIVSGRCAISYSAQGVIRWSTFATVQQSTILIRSASLMGLASEKYLSMWKRRFEILAGRESGFRQGDVSYWSLVLPLTLLSAWLLSKPQKIKS